MKILLVVDMQNDFIDGVFGTKEAQEIVPKVIAYVKNFDDKIVATMDTHYNPTSTPAIEDKELEKHCLYGSNGYAFPKDLEETLKDRCIIINKSTFGRTDLAICLNSIYKEDISAIYICGLCTDICVLNNAIILRNGLPFTKIVVLSDLCAGTTPENHQKALDLMKVNLIEVRESNEVQTNDK